MITSDSLLANLKNVIDVSLSLQNMKYFTLEVNVYIKGWQDYFIKWISQFRIWALYD